MGGGCSWFGIPLTNFLFQAIATKSLSANITPGTIDEDGKISDEQMKALPYSLNYGTALSTLTESPA